MLFEGFANSSEYRTIDDREEGTVKFRFRNVTNPRNIVGPVVRSLREERGLTQPLLVAKLNLLGWDISRETMAKIESQFRWVADTELLLLADALGVEAGEILLKARRHSTKSKSKIGGK